MAAGSRAGTNGKGHDEELPDLEPVTLSEVGTKLDLARAYMDMGDPEGARSILSEVLSEGSMSQKQEARRLMDALPGWTVAAGPAPAVGPPARRIALQIEYDGGTYAGWQAQASAPSIQQTLDAALAQVANAPVSLICAGPYRRRRARTRADRALRYQRAAQRTRAGCSGANTYLPPRDLPQLGARRAGASSTRATAPCRAPTAM